MVPKFLFAYGTLRPGFRNYPCVAPFTRRSFAATADGLQLLLAPSAGFPFAVPAPGARATGTLIQLDKPRVELALEACDWLESYDAERDTGLYLRRTTTVTSAETGVVEAWVYLAGPRVGTTALAKVPGNDWAQVEPRRWGT